jgi:hypothetical protein
MKCQNETVTVELKNGMFVFIVAYLCASEIRRSLVLVY